MAVRKLSIALDADVAEAASAAAKQDGRSLSSWLNEAVADVLAVKRGLAAVAEWEAENGAITDEERAIAAAILDRRPPPSS